MLASADRTRTILGVKFFLGTAAEAVERMRNGGLLVVPAAPALREMRTNTGYRNALLASDVAITDSSYMVMVWNLIARDNIPRVSGLEYLWELLKQPEVRKPRGTLWVMTRPASAERNLEWLRSQGIEVPAEFVHLAPMYGAEIKDEPLLQAIERLRPRHVIITVGGVTQERLGAYLKQRLSYLPAIHCIGAAIAFLSGDQVRIPMWADRLYLGWLFRAVSDPKWFVPRYWRAKDLLLMLVKYRERLPVA